MKSNAIALCYGIRPDIRSNRRQDIILDLESLEAQTDACEQAFICLSRTYSPAWVLEGDIKGCFDNISHQWLLDQGTDDKSISKTIFKSWLCI